MLRHLWIGVVMVLSLGDAVAAGADYEPLVAIWPNSYSNVNHRDSVYGRRGVRQWKAVAARTAVIMIGELELLPRTKGGMSDRYWKTVLKFCQRRGMRIAIVGWFGGYCGMPGFSPEIWSRYNPATIDALDAWQNDPSGGGKPTWERLASLCDRYRIPRSIIYAYVLDSPMVYNFNNSLGETCTEATPEVLARFASEMIHYVSFARQLFPGIALYEQDAPHGFYGVTAWPLDDLERLKGRFLGWIDLVKKNTDSAGMAYIYSFDLFRESGIEYSAYSAPFDKTYFLFLKALVDGCRDRGLLTTIEINETNMTIAPDLAGPGGNRVGWKEVIAWANLTLRDYGMRPDILEFIFFNGPNWVNLPEKTPEVDPDRDFTITQTTKDVLETVVDRLE